MLLSARLLNNVSNVNSFDVSLQTKFTEGDSQTIFIQLIDLNKDPEAKPLSGKRFVPATGATLNVVFKSNDTSKTVTKIATNPFPGDLSIFSFSVLPVDNLKGSWSILLALSQGGVVTNGRVDNAILIQPITGAYI